MMWECCRHLQKAQTLDGSGPMRLGSSFRFQSSKNPVIVALALGRPAMRQWSCVEACCGQMYSSPSSCNSNCDDEKECTYACDRISGMSPNCQLLCVLSTAVHCTGTSLAHSILLSSYRTSLGETEESQVA